MICVIQHPPYLPDLALADFLLILKVKMALKGGHFSNISDILLCMTELVKGVSLQDLPRGFPWPALTISVLCAAGRWTHLFFRNQCSFIIYQLQCVKHQNLWMHLHSVQEKSHDAAAYFLTWNLLLLFHFSAKSELNASNELSLKLN